MEKQESGRDPHQSYPSSTPSSFSGCPNKRFEAQIHLFPQDRGGAVISELRAVGGEVEKVSEVPHTHSLRGREQVHGPGKPSLSVWGASDGIFHT